MQPPTATVAATPDPTSEAAGESYALSAQIGEITIGTGHYVGVELAVGPLRQSVLLDPDSADTVAAQIVDAAAAARRSALGLTIAGRMPAGGGPSISHR